MVILNIQQIIIELFASNNISYIFKERSCFFMKKLQDYKFWFIVGSQFLYGPEALKAVEEDAKKMVEGLNASGKLPAKIEFKAVGTTAEVIDRFVMDANYDDTCAGIITWMHTFSPSKMWIRGLKKLQKPYLHLHTQYNREIPNEEIDMDFMNLNQSAHGDREHGFIGTRMRLARKIVVGYWETEAVQNKIATWMRTAIGVIASADLKVIRFGDNMRNVAVTEGDKVEAEIKALKEAAGDKILKVIIETCYLTDDEKVKLCQCVTNAKADYIKTSTGFGTGGATIEDIRLFAQNIGPDVKMKAAGGVKSREDLEIFLEAGCDRIGTSSAVKMLEEN